MTTPTVFTGQQRLVLDAARPKWYLQVGGSGLLPLFSWHRDLLHLPLSIAPGD